MKEKSRVMSTEDDAEALAQTAERLQEEMDVIRKRQWQMAKKPSPVATVFVSHLQKIIDDADFTRSFMQWFKILLDKWQRYGHVDPIMLKRGKLKGRQEENHAENEPGVYKHSQSQQIDNYVTVETMLQEVGQLYEASQQFPSAYCNGLNPDFLPDVVARLFLLGHPLQVFDGEASNTPTTWLKAVLRSITKIEGKKKVFVLSIIGAQGSGKSTLLNAMFGLSEMY